MSWDIALFRIINGWAGRFDGLDAIGIFAAVGLLPLMGFLLLLATFTVKRLKEEHWYEMPVHAVAAAAIAYGIRFVVGALVARPRPFVALQEVRRLVDADQIYASFPSGHAALAFAFAFVVFRRDRDWGIAFFILAALVAVGRVFVGVHYPLDILGGAVVGWFAAWVVGWVERKEWGKISRALRAH